MEFITLDRYMKLCDRNPRENPTHPQHNEILYDFMELSDGELTSKTVIEFLTKYFIDINYDNSMLLLLACITMQTGTNEINHKNIITMLKLGADPIPLMNQSILYELHPINQIRLDTIFKIYDYDCKWNNVDFDKLGEKLCLSDKSDSSDLSYFDSTDSTNSSESVEFV
jgi:hypothetical protein